VKWFDYAAPTSLAAAITLRAEHPGSRLLAGGTDLLAQLRSGRIETAFVIDVKRIPELNVLQYDPGGGLTLGAAVPCYRIYQDAAVSRAYPSLAEAAGLIGGTQIQGRASLGGNLANAAPSADSTPLLIALGAVCRIVGPGGERMVAVEDFCTGPGRTVLGPLELLVSLHIPAKPARSGAKYLRFIPRNEMDIAVAGAGVAVTLDDGVIRSARIALAAVAPTPLFVREAGDLLQGQPPAPEIIGRAAALAGEAARPITDMRGDIEYRRHLCAVLTRRALNAAIAKAQEAN